MLDLAVETSTSQYCLGYISETEGSRKLILGKDIGWEVPVWNIMISPDLTYDFTVVVLTCKNLSRPFLRSNKV